MSPAEKYTVALDLFSKLLGEGHALALARGLESFLMYGGGAAGLTATARLPTTFGPFAIDPVQAADALLVFQRALDREVLYKSISLAERPIGDPPSKN